MMIFDYHTKPCHLLPIRRVKRGSPAVIHALVRTTAHEKVVYFAQEAMSEIGLTLVLRACPTVSKVSQNHV